jgi:integration host factor subunit alpha
MALTKADLVENVAREGFTKKDSAKIVETVLELIKSTLKAGDEILISGFGKFCVKEKKQRRGRNPATGEDLILDARRVVTFKCSPVLTDKINGKSSVPG